MTSRLVSKDPASLAERIALRQRDLAEDGRFSFDEVQLALRNRGMPLEALRYPITPAGLHYLLTHFDIPDVDSASWRLEVRGKVARPLALSLDELKALPSVTLAVTMECAGSGRAQAFPRPVGQPWNLDAVSTASWTGVRVAEVLRRAGVEPDTVDVAFHGADHGVERGEEHTYARSLALDHALRDEVLLAWAMNGADLPPQHGAPLRLVVPGWYGMGNVKWLTRIEAIDRPFGGYQQAHNYHYRLTDDDPGVPVTHQKVRALLLPPGVPDFLSRARIVQAGRVRLTGRAWSGAGLTVTRVEVGVGGVWRDAVLGDPLGDYAWRGFSFDWNAPPGEYELSCRATDASGAVQPLESFWTTSGMGNNVAQKIAVLVRPG